jgi:hypothetical protein
MPSPLEQIVEEIRRWPGHLSRCATTTDGDCDCGYDLIAARLRAALSPDAGAIRESRDALQAMVERIVPGDVLSRDGTVQGVERWIAARIAIDYEAMGRECINAIIAGAMVRVDGEGPHVLVWSGNAAEQIGEALRRADVRSAAPAPSSPAAQYERRTTDGEREGFSRALDSNRVEVTERAPMRGPPGIVYLGEAVSDRAAWLSGLLSDLTRCESALSASQARVGEHQAEIASLWSKLSEVTAESDQRAARLADSESARDGFAEKIRRLEADELTAAAEWDEEREALKSALSAAQAEIARMKEIDDEQREMMAEAALAQGRRADALEKERDAALARAQAAEERERALVAEVYKAHADISADGGISEHECECDICTRHRAALRAPVAGEDKT